MKYITLILPVIFVASLSSCDSDEEQVTPEEQEQVVVIKPAEYHEYVDLGLPSGTLWAAYNIGASKPEEIGSYFAWGEISPKNNYNWQTYIDSENGSDSKFKKYYQNGGKTSLEPANDAAIMNWGDGWNTPTLNQIRELESSTFTKWKIVELNGVKGRLVVSLLNGNRLFLPAAGERINSNMANMANGYYWSSSLNATQSNSAYIFGFESNPVVRGAELRFVGLPIRPVRMTPIVSQ